MIISDNGPQYTSAQFKSFTKKWNIKHLTSSPGYPQSNGQAEAAVKIAKRLMKKAKKANHDPYLAILDYRNTPTEGLQTSPAQRLMCRRTQTLLPMNRKLLKQKVPENQKHLMNKKKQAQIKHYNKTARNLQPLKQGDIVRVQPTNNDKQTNAEWRKAQITKKLDQRSYEISTEKCTTLRRNRRHLRSTAETMRAHDDAPDMTSEHERPQEQQVVLEEQVTPEQQVELQQHVDKSKQQHYPPSITNKTRAGRSVKKPSRFNDYDMTK